MNSLNLGFLMYDSRSGSTWLASLLHGYSSIVVLKESTFTSRILSFDSGISKEQYLHLRSLLVSDMQNLEVGFDLMHLLDELYTEDIEPMKYLNMIFESIRDELGLEINQMLIVKDQLFSSSKILLEHFPHAFYFSLVRDGWEVFLSTRNTLAIDGLPFTSSVITSAIRWNYFANCSFRLSDKAARHVVLNYEHLKINGRQYLETSLEKFGILGSEYSEARTREYALKIGSSQKGLHNNVLKAKVSSSYDYRNGEKKLYRLLTKYHAQRMGYINIENTLSPLTIIYWFVIDLGRYIGQKIKSKREFKL